MKKTYSILCAFVLAGSFFGCSTTQQKTSETDYTQYVNTFIGAADNGHTFPGACRPFSMIQTSPVTGAIGWRYCSEYVYTDSLIDRKSTRLNSSHTLASRMPSSA